MHQFRLPELACSNATRAPHAHNRPAVPTTRFPGTWNAAPHPEQWFFLTQSSAVWTYTSGTGSFLVFSLSNLNSVPGLDLIGNGGHGPLRQRRATFHCRNSLRRQEAAAELPRNTPEDCSTKRAEKERGYWLASMWSPAASYLQISPATTPPTYLRGLDVIFFYLVSLEQGGDPRWCKEA